MPPNPFNNSDPGCPALVARAGALERLHEWTFIKFSELIRKWKREEMSLTKRDSAECENNYCIYTDTKNLGSFPAP